MVAILRKAKDSKDYKLTSDPDCLACHAQVVSDKKMVDVLKQRLEKVGCGFPFKIIILRGRLLRAVMRRMERALCRHTCKRKTSPGWVMLLIA